MSIDSLAINTIRCLSADQVQAANSGHPGAPMGCAPIAHALFGHIMRFSPTNPSWWARDRFVLSNGHACALLYSVLHLSGYNLGIDDLKAFRRLDSRTPGHPERNVTPGVEVTTGPLGQGIASAVGLAVAQSHFGSLYPDLFDNFTFVLCGDGCLQEGVANEAAALAGQWGLGRLILIYDDNSITIDGATSLSFTEDISMRFKAIGWEVLSVSDGDNDFMGIVEAINAAKQNTKQPSLIRVKTTIGFGSSKAGSEKTHGSPLGLDDLQNVKLKFGLDPTKSFQIPDAVSGFYTQRAISCGNFEREWNERFHDFTQKHPEDAVHLANRFENSFFVEPIKYPIFTGDKATRSTSGDILAVLVESVRAFIGGSADLTESTLSNKAALAPYSSICPGNRFIHFGVREHAMTAIANGLHAYGGILPFVATFANFISYCWPSLRLAALSHHQILFLATHDSIDLGEDGPTHQPIEILSLLRSTPNIIDLRPADGNETIGAYQAFMCHRTCPSVLLLSRSAIPQLHGSSADAVSRGAYILAEYPQEAKKCVLAGSGTEVHLLVDARIQLERMGVSARVVSFPSWFLFSEQSESYQREIFPPGVPVLMVEAARVLGWQRWADDVIEMTSFGASGSAKDLRSKFGFTVDAIVKRALQLLR